jgi:hypothetical protein
MFHGTEGWSFERSRDRLEHVFETSDSRTIRAGQHEEQGGIPMTTAIRVGTVGRAGSAPGDAAQPKLPLERPGSRRPVPQAARDLLADAGRGLGRAIRAGQPADRYATAHLAALRAAAALLAARARPGGRGNQGNAWTLLAKVAPELGEWAAFFAAGSGKRQAAEAGIGRLIGAREADDMVRQVSAFLDLVESAVTGRPV